MRWRGWVEVVRSATGWDVYDWSEHLDSGSCLSSHDDFESAERAALRHASRHRRKYEGATVSPMVRP